MRNKAFIDTNILVYAHDLSASDKRDMAKNLIARLITMANGVVSTQVFQEFYVASTKKLGIAPELSKNILQALQALEVITITPNIIFKSIDRQIHWNISFWDALILESAAFSHCSVLYTEDLSHGQQYGSVKVINPFLPGFELP